jgi:Fe-Mn family superoxide dismutase
MKNNPSRREFLATTAKAGLTVGLVGTAFSDLLAHPAQAVAGTGFTQTPLPYAYTALEPHIDARTMEIHYSKHAAAYASNLRDAAKEEGVDTTLPLEQVLATISKYSPKMRNNGGGHYNHELFWSILGAGASPEAGPEGGLLKAIKTSFGSYAALGAGARQHFKVLGQNAKQWRRALQPRTILEYPRGPYRRRPARRGGPGWRVIESH